MTIHFFPFGLRLGILRISRLSVMSELRIRTSLRTLWRRPFKNKCFKHCSNCIILWLQSPTFQIGHQTNISDSSTPDVINTRCLQHPSPTSILPHFISWEIEWPTHFPNIEAYYMPHIESCMWNQYNRSAFILGIKFGTYTIHCIQT